MIAARGAYLLPFSHMKSKQDPILNRSSPSGDDFTSDGSCPSKANKRNRSQEVAYSSNRLDWNVLLMVLNSLCTAVWEWLRSPARLISRGPVEWVPASRTEVFLFWSLNYTSVYKVVSLSYKLLENVDTTFHPLFFLHIRFIRVEEFR